MLVKEGPLFSVEHFPLNFQFIKSLVILFLGGLLEQFLGGFWDLGLFGDIFFVVVEFGPCVSWWSFLLGPDWLRRPFIFMFLLPILGFLLNLLLVLRLLGEWLGWIDQSLLNIFLGYVLRHYI